MSRIPGSILRPYQSRTLRALLTGIERCAGETFTVMFPRQAGKNEVSATLVAFLLMSNARRGGAVIVTAPTFRPQAAISLERTRRILDSLGHLVPLQPKARDHVLELGNARAIFLSASPEAHVAGHTASLALIADEAQDIDADWFNRQFRPMAASTGAATVMFGTPWDGLTLLEQAVTRNRALDRDGTRNVRLHHQVSWQEVARSVPAYGDYVRFERERLGASHPLFLSQYELRTVQSAGRMFNAGQLQRLRGEHLLLQSPQPGERYVAGLDFGGDGPAADATVLTIGRVTGVGLEVVATPAWQGLPYTDMLDGVRAELRHWRLDALTVDATGLGEPLAEILEREAIAPLERITFTAATKSELGYELLAAANTGRLAIPTAGFEALWAELRACRASTAPGRLLRWGNDAGHDDYVVSLALCLRASRKAGPPRRARGRARNA